MGPVRTFTSHFYIIYFHNILSTKPKTSKRSLPHKNPKTIHYSSRAYYIPESFSFSLILTSTTNHETPYYAVFFSFQLLPLRAKYFLQHPILKQFILCSSLHMAKINFTILQSTRYNFFFSIKKTERQTFVKETDANIPRISSVHSPFANEILSF